jgi:hypothetical protein
MSNEKARELIQAWIAEDKQLPPGPDAVLVAPREPLGEPLRTHLGWLLAKVMTDARYPEARGIWERFCDWTDAVRSDAALGPTHTPSRYVGKEIGIHGPAGDVAFCIASEVDALVAGLRQEIQGYREAVGDEADDVRDEVQRRREAFRAVLVRAESAEAEVAGLRQELHETKDKLARVDGSAASSPTGSTAASNETIRVGIESTRGVEFLGSLKRCPCCDFRTLEERGGYNICPICFWEDDGDWALDDELCRCGPNHGKTLGEGREHYRHYGAADIEMVAHVRPPKAIELAERERWHLSGRPLSMAAVDPVDGRGTEGPRAPDALSSSSDLEGVIAGLRDLIAQRLGEGLPGLTPVSSWAADLKRIDTVLARLDPGRPARSTEET